MIFNFANNLSTGSNPFGAISMNFGGGGAGEEPPAPTTGENTGLGGAGLSFETGISAGVGLSPTVGLSKRVR